MRPAALLLLGLACLVSGAAALTCKDGWTNVDETLRAAMTNSTESVWKQYGGLLDGMPDQFACGKEGPQVDWEGCQQEIQGSTMYRLFLNVTCPTPKGDSVTVVLRVDLFKDAKGDIKVGNMDDEAVLVNGKLVGNDLGDLATDLATAQKLNSLDDLIDNDLGGPDADFDGDNDTDLDDLPAGTASAVAGALPKPVVNAIMDGDDNDMDDGPGDN